MPTHTEKSEQLKQMIRFAFPTDVSLSHEDCLEHRTSLVAIRDEDVLNLLGLVLIDLIETHRTTHETGPDYVDSVVRLLCGANPPPLGSAPGLDVNKNVLCEMENFYTSHKRSAEKLFRKFTLEQSRAVLEWLKAASLWEKSFVPSDEMEAALTYWKMKLEKATIEPTDGNK